MKAQMTVSNVEYFTTPKSLGFLFMSKETLNVDHQAGEGPVGPEGT